ncbi:hypothetical protein V8E51_004944 [Hyaloscypha variabilis]
MSLHRPKKGKGRRGGFDEVDQLSDGFDEDLKISNASRFNAASEEQNTRKWLKARCKLLEERLATKTHELEQAIDKISGLREQSYTEELWSDLADARAAKDFFEAEAERLRSALSAKNIELGKEVHKNSILRKDIKALNLRSETLKPLVDIGVATRLRSLQQARQTIHKHRISEVAGWGGGPVGGGVTLSEADKVVIKSGNIAAHGGNGRADAAVFMSYLVSKTHVLAETFKDLYHCKPSEYLDQSEIKMLERMLDCEATIIAVQRVNKSNDSASLRAEHSYLLEKLYDAQTSSASIAVWESSLSIE